MTTEEIENETVILTDIQPETLEALLARQRDEMRAALDRLLQEQHNAGLAARGAIREDAAEALAGTLAVIETQLAKARQSDSLVAMPVIGGPPPELAQHLRQAEQAATDGERAIVVMVPRQTSTNAQEKRAWLVADCSRDIWG